MNWWRYKYAVIIHFFDFSTFSGFCYHLEMIWHSTLIGFMETLLPWTMGTQQGLTHFFGVFLNNVSMDLSEWKKEYNTINTFYQFFYPIWKDPSHCIPARLTREQQSLQTATTGRKLIAYETFKRYRWLLLKL